MKTSIIPLLLGILFIMTFHSCKSPTAPKDTSQTDTTSHNFSSQMFEFGDVYSTGMPSQLYDVAIVNENDIWAVGEIYLKDTTGQSWADIYNALHWDGNSWKLFKFQFYVNYGNEITRPVPIRSVFALKDGTVLISSTNGQFSSVKNGIQQKVVNVPLDVYKIWAKDTTDIYLAGFRSTPTSGPEGGIAHYDGREWQKIQSGTTMKLFDIYSADGKNVYASGGDNSNSGILLKGNANGFKTLMEGRDNVNEDSLFNPYFIGNSQTVWISPSNTIYMAGNFLYSIKQGQMGLVSSFEGNKPRVNINGKYFGFLMKIRGNSENDMVVAGDGTTIRHYNGVSWKQIGMPYNFWDEHTWLSVDMKGSTIATVGRAYLKGIIMLLKR